MSSSFANILVRRDSSVTTEMLEGVVTRYLRSRGWVKSDEAAATRGVSICSDGDWLVVYDSGIEQGRAGDEQHDLASVISLETKALTLATLVSTSNHLMMGLYARGEQSCVVERGPTGCRLPPRLLSTWMKRFPGCDPRAFASALTQDETFVEDNLRKAAIALRLPDAICTGFRYARQDGALTTSSLSFALAASVAPTSPKLGAVNVCDFHCRIDSKREWGPTFRNFGAAFTGLRVDLAGDAIEDGQVFPLSLRVHVNGRDVFATFERARERFVAVLPGVEVPAGMAAERLEKLRSANVTEWLAVAMPCLISTHIELSGTSRGQGQIAIEVRPEQGGNSARQTATCTVNDDGSTGSASEP